MKIRRKEDLVGNVECVGFPFKTPGDWFAIDTEGTGLDPWGTRGVDRPHEPARPFMFQLCNADGETAYIRWQVNPRTRGVKVDKRTFVLLQELLGNPTITKIFHNTSYDRRMLRMSGFHVAGPCFDTLIGMHVINPDEMTYGLKALGKKYLDIPDTDEKELADSVQKARREARKLHRDWKIATKEWFGDEPHKADFWLADPKLCVKYGLTDAIRTATLYLAELQQLDEDEAAGGKMWTVLQRELSLMDVIADMEDRGIRLDVERTTELRTFYQDYCDKAQKEIDKHGGKGLNPKSPKQMCQLFFGKLGLKPLTYSQRDDDSFVPCPHCKTVVMRDGKPVIDVCRTKKGKLQNRKRTVSRGCKICQDTGHSPKCDGEFLFKVSGEWDEDAQGNDYFRIDNPLAYWILNYDAAKHMLSSFIDAYLQLKAWDAKHKCWVLHPNYKQCGPITGRLSCERPNLMNVASNTTGRKKADVPYRPRECFSPREGYTLYLPDYSQVEVWVFAFLAQDSIMMEPLLAGEDFHGGISRRVWGHLWNDDLVKSGKAKKPEDLTKDEKKNLDIFAKCRKRSKLLMFCKLYGGGAAKVAGLLGVTVAEAEEFIKDYDGRLPGVKKYMSEMVALARRQGYVINPFGRRYPIDRNFAYKATNYMVQGTAAEIMKNALIRVYALSQTPKYKGKMFVELTIHDELVIEVHNSIHNNETMTDVCKAMQQDHKVIGCPRPFPVGMKIATERWSLTQEIEDV